MSDPISRLQFARQEINAAEHPDVVAAVMMSAASDLIARAINDVAAALLETEDPPDNGAGAGIMRARALLVP
jgi:hypothetical protein